MRIAVVQHRLRATAGEDAGALADAAIRAVADGAALVVLPEVPSLRADRAARESLGERLAVLRSPCVHPTAPDSWQGADSLSADEGAEPLRVLGKVAVLIGDACIDSARLVSVREDAPSVAILSPGAENDLQAESFLELALALSDSLAGLVILAECVGAEPGDPGHGGSAVVLLGEVMAEALDDDEVILADVVTPVVRPEPLEPLPEIPLLLRQRLAFHAGSKLEPSGYPADVT